MRGPHAVVPSLLREEQGRFTAAGKRKPKKVTAYLEDREQRSHHLGSQTLLLNEQSLI